MALNAIMEIAGMVAIGALMAGAFYIGLNWEYRRWWGWYRAITPKNWHDDDK